MTLERAREIAGDRATITAEADIFRVTGAFHRDGVRVAMDIATELHPQDPSLPDFWPERHVIAQAGYVGVRLHPRS